MPACPLGRAGAGIHVRHSLNSTGHPRKGGSWEPQQNEPQPSAPVCPGERPQPVPSRLPRVPAKVTKGDTRGHLGIPVSLHSAEPPVSLGSRRRREAAGGPGAGWRSLPFLSWAPSHSSRGLPAGCDVRPARPTSAAQPETPAALTRPRGTAGRQHFWSQGDRYRGPVPSRSQGPTQEIQSSPPSWLSTKSLFPGSSQRAACLSVPP